jgi:hypothetical protein
MKRWPETYSTYTADCALDRKDNRAHPETPDYFRFGKTPFHDAERLNEWTIFHRHSTARCPRSAHLSPIAARGGPLSL